MIVVIVIVAGGGSAKSKSAAKTLIAAGCQYKHLPALPRTPHYATLNPSPKPKWNSYPPSSGRHYFQPVLWGDYSQPVPIIKEVHNLEHGGMIIQYGDKVPKSDVTKINAFWQNDPTAMLVAPLPNLGDKIALHRVDELGRMHDVQPEGVQGVPVGVPLPRSRVAGLPEERAAAGNVTRLA